jgi:hypothetical protein
MARREYPGVYPYPAAGGRTCTAPSTPTQAESRVRSGLHEPKRRGQVPLAHAGAGGAIENSESNSVLTLKDSILSDNTASGPGVGSTTRAKAQL